MRNRIDILLATFHGDRYLKDQIDSILAQTATDWRLIIRDDCSTDRTPEIIRGYVEKFPDKIVVLDSGGERLGSCQNFARLLEYSTAEYLMFCDQDDVWLPHKIAVTLEKFHELEASLDRQTPLMVFSDLTVVDEHLQVIAESFRQHLRLKPENSSRLNRLVLQSVANGCAMMINKPLRDRALPIPAKAITHDWWLTMVAAVFGRSAYLAEPILLYRQHSMNVAGAESPVFLRRVSDFLTPQKREAITARRNSKFARLQDQAGVFLEQYGNFMTEKDRRMLQDFLEIHRQGFWGRKYSILKNGFLYGNTMDNIGLLLFR